MKAWLLIAIIVEDNIIAAFDLDGEQVFAAVIDIDCETFPRELWLAEVSVDDEGHAWLVGRIRGQNGGYRSWLGMIQLP